MGRTKSWLALALAIVMVLGMGVPTAFAAPGSPGSIWFSAGRTAGAYLDLTVGDDPAEVTLRDTSGSGIQLTDWELGQAPKVTITNQYNNVSATFADGVITIDPLMATPGTTARSLTVTVASSNEDGSWNPASAAGWASGDYWSGTLYYRVRAGATSESVELDINRALNKYTKSIQLKALGTDSPVTAASVDSITRSAGSNVVFNGSATQPANGFITISAAGLIQFTAPTSTVVTGVGTVRVRLTVDNAYVYVNIPYVVGYTSGTLSHHVEADATEVLLKTSDNTAKTVNVKVVDVNGHAPNPAWTANLAVTNSTPSVATVTPSTVLSGGDLRITPVDAGTTTIYVSGAGLVPAKITVTVSTPKVTASPSPITLNVNKNTTVLDSVIVTFTSGTDAVDATSASSVCYPAAKVDLAARAGLNANQMKFALNGNVDAAGVARLTISGITVNGKPADSVAINVNINDITTRPFIDALDSDGNVITEIVLDRHGNLTKQIIFTARGDGAKIDAGMTCTSNSALAGLTVGPFTYTTVAPSATVKGSLTIGSTAAQALGNRTLTVNGSVGGIAIKPYTIPVRVIDSDPDTINAIVSATTAINQPVLLNNGVASFTVSAVNSVGKKLDLPAGTTAGNRQRFSATITYDSGYTSGLTFTTPAMRALAPSSTNGSQLGLFEMKATEPTKGKITVGLYTNWNADGTPSIAPAAVPINTLVIPFNFGVVEIKGSPETVTLDLKDADSSKQTFVVSPVEAGGVLTNAGVSLVSIKGSGVTVAKVAGTVGDFTITADPLTAKEGDSGYIDISGSVNGVVASRVQRYKYVVTKTSSMKVNKDVFEFNLGSTSVQQDNLIITPIPTTDKLVVTSVKPDVATFVSVTNTATSDASVTYQIKALAAGEGTIVIDGTVGGKAVPPVTVKYKVVASTNVIIPTPSSMTLNIAKDDEKSKQLTFAGPLATDKVEITSIKSLDEKIATVSLLPGSTTIYVVTGVAKGATSVVASGKLNGVAVADVTVPVTVVDGTALEGVYINGVHYAGNGVVNTLWVPNNYMAEGFAVTIQDAYGNIAAANKLSKPKSETKRITLLRKIPNTFVPLKWGKQTLIAQASASTTPSTVILDIKPLMNTAGAVVPVLGVADPKVGQRGYIFDYVTTEPANAFYTQAKYWSLSSSDAAKASIKSNGIVTFKAGGEVTLTAKSVKGSNPVTLTVKLSVTDAYTTTKLHAALLSSSSNAANIKTALGKASYPGGATTVVDVTNTKAGFDKMVADMKASVGADDIFMLYVDTGISKSGLKFSDGNTLSLGNFALALGEIPGKVVIMMNGSSAKFFTAKDVAASNADVINAFAKAEAAYQAKASSTMTAVGTNGYPQLVPKFYVISATAKTAQTTNAARMDAFEKAFLAGIAINAEGKLVVTGTDSITLYELYNDMKPNFKSNAPIAMYPSGSDLRVFMNRVLTAPAQP